MAARGRSRTSAGALCVGEVFDAAVSIWSSTHDPIKFTPGLFNLFLVRFAVDGGTGGAYLRFTNYDLRCGKFGELCSRLCEALAEVKGKIMSGCWLESIRIYAMPSLPLF